MRPSPIAVIAPHGGGIEPRTSRIAEAIAASDCSLYLFNGTKSHDNGDLHITSSNFDEPQAVALVAGADWVIAIHGREHGREHGEDSIYLGGLDSVLIGSLREHLEAAGFSTAMDPIHRGEDPRNICNRGRRGRGTQLEMPMQARRNLMRRDSSGDVSRLTKFAAAVRDAIHAVAAPTE